MSFNYLLSIIALSFFLLVSVSNQIKINRSLYGIKPVQQSGLGIRLILLDVNTLNEIPIHPEPAINDNVFALQASTIDLNSRIYYLLAFNETSYSCQLLGLSLDNGLIVKNWDMPLGYKKFAANSCDFNPNENVIFVSGYLESGLLAVLRLSVETGMWTPLYTTNQKVENIPPVTSYDFKNNTLWILVSPLNKFGQPEYEGGVFLLIDGKTGKLLRDLPNSALMTTINYDVLSNKMVGLGQKMYNNIPNQLIDVIVTIDLTNGKNNYLTQKTEGISGLFSGKTYFGVIDYKMKLIYFLVRDNTDNFQWVYYNYETNHIIYEIREGTTVMDIINLQVVY
ncbi:hypothetical protein ABK040_012295 [Willaertia magna]